MDSQIITASNLVYFGTIFVTVVLPILAAIIGGTWKITRTLSKFESRIVELESDRFTLTAASEHALRMALSNPELVVHDPRNPSEIINRRMDGESK